MIPTIIDTDTHKIYKSTFYNYIFDKTTGFFARWGSTEEEDPLYAPSPEIMDLEISTICHGVGMPCRFCYKSNTRKGTQMSFETFKKLFNKLPRNITQIAFGIGDIFGHPDMWKIFEHTRANGIVPNVTINGYGLTDEYADRLGAVMGAVAVSRYNPKGTCYDAIKALTDRGMTQVNIHQLVSEETYADCLEVLQDAKTDPRLEKLNAIVFLMLKPKGRGEKLHKLNDFAKYKALVDFALDNNISVGFDSCSAPSFLSAVIKHNDFESFQMAADPCESGLFSIYANVHGEVFPCSFTEGTPGWETGLSILDCNDFVEDIWNHPRMVTWREKLLVSTEQCTGCSLQASCRSCPIYEIDLCRSYSSETLRSQS